MIALSFPQPETIFLLMVIADVNINEVLALPLQIFFSEDIIEAHQELLISILDQCSIVFLLEPNHHESIIFYSAFIFIIVQRPFPSPSQPFEPLHLLIFGDSLLQKELVKLLSCTST
mmetsp:Transcript_12794/g.12703  ORF Transcript_12794/g.12703 Transcript_12794/m.12703 type:complete len:117 (-) Transcript_12794:231-581(-)